VFVSEIQKRFPNSHAIIAKMRQDLKVYQFDLSNIINDLKLMADSTSHDVDKTNRTLNLRKKILDGHRMSPEKDQKIWNQTIKMQVNNMTASIEKCDVIIKALTDLQKAVKVCNDTLEAEIVALRKKLEASNTNLKRKLADLEKKMRAIGCVNNSAELLRAIFTLGLACLLGKSDTQKEYENVKADLVEEQAIIQAIAKRMNYFDDLLESAATLVRESAGVLETTKTFKQALVIAKTVLERDYTPSDVAENLGDVDFANDFAEELWKTLNELKQVAETVANDCLQRKHRLDAALIGINKYFGDDKKEEEMIELAAVTDNQLGVMFNKMSDSCSDWFEGVSSEIDRVQNGYVTQIIEKIQNIKDLLLLNAKDQYSDAKISLFAVLDAARDVQLKVESAQYRIGSNTHKINRYIGKKANWYYQHKYSTRTVTNCRDDRKIVEAEEAKLDAAATKFLTKDLKALAQTATHTIAGHLEGQKA